MVVHFNKFIFICGIKEKNIYLYIIEYFLKMENIDNTQTINKPNIIIIHTTYHQSQAKACKKYYNQHKEELYEKLKEKINNDPELKRRRAESVKKYREKKKIEKFQQNNILNQIETE